jgi:transcriptional regulator with XRE-family HTH domain
VPPGVRGFDPAALRAARRSRGLTQADLANLVGVQRTYAVQWERPSDHPGATPPTPQTLAALAEALGVHPRELTTIRARDATLADLRAWAGLTQAELARSVGVSPSALGMIERGERRPTRELVDALAEVLHEDAAFVRRACSRS